MTKILTTQNAEITTATVEVKTLTISGKQVTLSVFRQLRERQLVSWSGELAGTPWGYVNYHPDKCGDDPEHLHIVWQDGNALYRSRYDKPRWIEAFYADWADEAVQGAYCRNGHTLPHGFRLHTDYVDGQPLISVRFRVGSVNCEALRPRMHGSAEQCMSEADNKEAWDGLNAEVADEVARRRLHEDCWAELSALPHLFIAV